MLALPRMIDIFALKIRAGGATTAFNARDYCLLIIVSAQQHAQRIYHISFGIRCKLRGVLYSLRGTSAFLDTKEKIPSSYLTHNFIISWLDVTFYAPENQGRPPPPLLPTKHFGKRRRH